MSGTDSRISTLEEQFTKFTSTFSSAMKDFHKQTKRQVAKQNKTLECFLKLLKGQQISCLKETI